MDGRGPAASGRSRAQRRSAGGRDSRDGWRNPRRGFNSPVRLIDPTAHAEMLAIREAARAAGNYRLENATLYATLEPCVMCAGALVQARIGRLVFGARDLRFGGVRSKFRLADSAVLNHRLEITEGVRAAECLEMLKRFFAARREHSSPER